MCGLIKHSYLVFMLFFCFVRTLYTSDPPSFQRQFCQYYRLVYMLRYFTSMTTHRQLEKSVVCEGTRSRENIFHGYSVLARTTHTLTDHLHHQTHAIDTNGSRWSMIARAQSSTFAADEKAIPGQWRERTTFLWTTHNWATFPCHWLAKSHWWPSVKTAPRHQAMQS